VFLIHHTYVTGWQLPGGGVEPGENLSRGAEARIDGGGADRGFWPSQSCMGCSSTTTSRAATMSRSYVVRKFRQDRMPEPNHEISACGFFAVDALPADTTEGTRRRIAEVVHGEKPIATWR